MSTTGAESPLTTSLWHRSLVAEEAKDRLARRQANAAVALLRLGREQKVWPILQHRPDPRTRSYLIHRFGPLDVDPHQVLAQLETQGEVSIRRALILILGEFNEQQLPPVERERLTPRLLDLYANDPDPGIHGAVDWTLRQWGHQTELQRADRDLATGKPEGNRRWYVNRQGQTLVIIPPTGEFVIGSPPTEVGREGGPEGEIEMQRFVRIDHAFAVMSHQVSVAEFIEFRQDFPYRITFSPESGCPMNNVSWYDAVAYCNWLNEQEGIPQEQWCYLPNDQGEYAEGMSIVPDFLQRTGYRLLTEAEWEFACRAGSMTSRYYGQSWDLDNHYACNVQNAMGRRTAMVGTFKPNDLGLFDMLGNVVDWCHTAFGDHLRATEIKCGDDLLPEVVHNQSKRQLRSPSFILGFERTRAAYHQGFPPNARAYLMGLRVSRVCALAEGIERGERVRDSVARSVRSSTSFQSSGQTRSSYRTNYPPNFGTWPWGFRTARTLG
jgi:eukaryotic-like serine/threonine-protein kinase